MKMQLAQADLPACFSNFSEEIVLTSFVFDIKDLGSASSRSREEIHIRHFNPFLAQQRSSSFLPSLWVLPCGIGVRVFQCALFSICGIHNWSLCLESIPILRCTPNLHKICWIMGSDIEQSVTWILHRS